MKRAWILLAALLIATPAAAQDSDESVAGVRTLYQQVRGWITAAAEQVPENLYSYRPTEEVRTFGQIIGHLASASYAFCAPVHGEESPSTQNAEELTSKAELRRALAEGFAYL